MNKSFLRLFPFLFLLSSCAINSAPDNNVDFLPQANLSNLSGIYSNYGEPNGYFSKDALGLNEISHEQVKLVKLTAGKNTVRVQLIENDCISYEKTLLLGRDVQEQDGRLVVYSESHLLSSGGDDVMIGPRHSEKVFGIDMRQDGKLRDSGYGAGLVMFLLPIAVSDQTDIRFKRMNTAGQHFFRCGR